jgi:pimeloyl-ACP methyl ester carboxylesterase
LILSALPTVACRYASLSIRSNNVEISHLHSLCAMRAADIRNCTSVWRPSLASHSTCTDSYTFYGRGVVVSATTDVTVTAIPAVAENTSNPSNPTFFDQRYYWQVTTPDGGTHKLAAIGNHNFRAEDGSGWLFNSSIVLVHGAWADGSYWSNVILPLEQRGLHVIRAPIPMSSLTNDATALKWALERTSGPVVLVGHAYSGAVIAAVQEERVKSLVYISALAPDEGETVAKVFYLNPSSPEAPKMVPDSHGFVWMPDDGFRRAVTHKASVDQAKIAAATQRPIAV